MRLSAHHRPEDLGRRLGVHGGSIESWIRRDTTPNEANKQALIHLELADMQAERDDTTIYMVQAMRRIEHLAKLEGETISLQHIVERLLEAGAVADRTLTHLEAKIRSVDTPEVDPPRPSR